jgi:nucleoside-diphosphate kinase
MTDRTLVIIKPDALCQRVVGNVISRLEQDGLRIIAARMVSISEKRAAKFYACHKGKDFYEPLVKFISSNPCIVMVWGGENVIDRVREIVGATDPVEAKDGTIRRQFAKDNRHNVIHASDSPETASREISFFFKEKEIYQWNEREYHK